MNNPSVSGRVASRDDRAAPNLAHDFVVEVVL
jgi:hypothetical protein